MPYKITSASQVVSEIDNALVGLRQQSVSTLASMNGGPVSTTLLENYYTTVSMSAAFLADRKTTTGLDAFAKSAKGDPTLDIVSELTSIETSLLAIRDWLEANMSKGPSDWIQSSKFVNNAIELKNYGKPATSELRTLTQTLIDLLVV